MGRQWWGCQTYPAPSDTRPRLPRSTSARLPGTGYAPCLDRYTICAHGVYQTLAPVLGFVRGRNGFGLLLRWTPRILSRGREWRGP
jgi:hypothetical protein